MKIRLFLLCIILPVGVFAQQEEKPLRYWGKTEEFLTEQADETFRLIDRILEETPPCPQEPLIRKSALLHLDWILHDTRYDNSEPFYRFIRNRIEQVVAELRQPVAEGMKVCKFYNHSFVVKTKSVTVAFDLYRGGKKDLEPYITDEMMQTIVDQCDIMFITHPHGDHADGAVAEMFIKAGKPVVVPAGLWDDKKEGIRHIRPEKMTEETLRLPSGKSLRAKIMSGHQGELVNNIYIITTPEGISVAHTGDQWNTEDNERIAKINEHASTDILLVHCWAMPLENIVNGFDPRLVITGHENEMNHAVDHREPHWLNYRRMEKVTQPKIFMSWGESYHWIPES